MRTALRSIAVAIALVVVLAIVAFFVFRAPIERALFLADARRATGMPSLDVDAVEREADADVVTNLRASATDGSVRIVARKAIVRLNAGTTRIDLDRPNVRFDPFAYDARRDAIDADVHVHDGTLEIGRAARPSNARLTSADGTLSLRRARATYDGAFDLAYGGASYPVTGGVALIDGRRVQTWTAARLPLAALWPAPDAADAGEPPTFAIAGGFVERLAVTDAADVDGTAELAGVRIALGTHVLAGLHGTIVGRGGGIGTRALDGSLDGLPFHAAGEVHDLPPRFRWLIDGSRDLRSLAKLAGGIAREPNLRGPITIEATAPGLSFGQYGMMGEHGPVAVSILALDPTEKTVRFDTAIASDRIISGGERTSAMGLRTKAVAGVNGDYFDIGRTYQPQGMLVRGGTLVRGPTDRAVLAIDRENRVSFGEFRMHGFFRTSAGTLPITEYNDWPPGHVAVITPAFGTRLPPADVTFVELKPLDGIRYRVTAVEKGFRELDVRFGVAIGPLSKLPLPRVGETVEMSYGTTPSLAGAVAAIGGGPILLRDGVWYEDPHAPAPDERDVRWPVIALARMGDGYLDLIAVDGRHPERSIGMTRPEFGDLLLRLGGVDAMALDSGGSVTMVSRAPGDDNVSVRNVPSDDSAERWVSDGLFIYSSAPPPTIVRPRDATTPVPETRPSP